MGVPYAVVGEWLRIVPGLGWRLRGEERFRIQSGTFWQVSNARLPPSSAAWLPCAIWEYGVWILKKSSFPYNFSPVFACHTSLALCYHSFYKKIDFFYLSNDSWDSYFAAWEKNRTLTSHLTLIFQIEYNNCV